MKYIIAYDVGTTGLKTCLFKVDKTIEMVAGESEGYPLYVLPNGGVEQDGDDWFHAMVVTTKKVLKTTKIDPKDIKGISFCSQMQGLILVDKDCKPVHRPMSYMDQRSKEELKNGIAYGIQVAGANIFKLIPSLIITGAVTSSVKDPVWKYKWIEANEPDNFAKAYRWLDVKDYLIARITGEYTMTEDSAFGTLIYDTRKNKKCWSKKLCKMFGIKTELLPKIIKSTDFVGTLKTDVAKELGLDPDTKVFGGGGDSSLIGVGAGCVKTGDTHIYSGTSGWVSTITDKQMVDVNYMIAAICGAQNGKFNYFAEMETAGKCLEWVRDHLALDEIGVYMEEHHILNDYASRSSLYTYMTEAIKDIPPGSNGVIFTPWLHGNRCPFEDPNAVGMFTGIKIETGKTELIHAVAEGILFHLRWMLECQDNKLKTKETIRFVGGGALSPIMCQMLADIIGRKVETVKSPQNVGAVGAAAVAAVGLGYIPKLEDVSNYIPASQSFEPDMNKHVEYSKYFNIFKQLYKTNKKIFKKMGDIK